MTHDHTPAVPHLGDIPDEDLDQALDVRELSAVYLGGTPLRRFAHAGLVTEHTPGAVRRLDAALETDRLPFTADND
ncbi:MULTISPECIES: sterol carrier protein domain-containing protein [Streptomyces]|uniref:sterol carrier protein domain-containing protein n=1 Tax=Streptomyces TaxID=1883 RepID=UPI0024A34ED0|nr:hypothetical protein Stsp01_47490 [Streptomyces sp. NBRC 13847]